MFNACVWIILTCVSMFFHGLFVDPMSLWKSYESKSLEFLKSYESMSLENPMSLLV